MDIQSVLVLSFEFSIDPWRSRGGDVEVNLQMGLVKGTKSTSPYPELAHFLN
jgi:hypothetical protein